jgi:hypothetical protein
MNERTKDLLIAIFGYCLATVCFWGLRNIPIRQWQLKFGVYGGTFTMLIYVLRLRIAAEGIDPDSKEAFKEYLKLGSCYVFVLFMLELPLMLAMI